MVINNEQINSSSISDYSAPAIGADGQWGSAGGIAVRESLVLGSMDGAMELLRGMDEKAVVGTLREAGFMVPSELIKQGTNALIASIQSDLAAAAALKVDGFGLSAARAVATAQSFAAKDYVEGAMNFAFTDFAGDPSAATSIQRLLHSDSVSIDLLGDAAPGTRGALLLVAGQALSKNRQGFGFDGIPGKYEIALSMGDVLDLHREAAHAVTLASARSALGVWVAGGKDKDLNEWVPDSIQRLLHGSVSLAAAEVVVGAIESGTIERHAGDIGNHAFTRLLADQGFDVHAPTVEQQAKGLDLVMAEPDRNRGQYIGTVAGLDHRAALIKFNRTTAIELPFAALDDGQNRPVMGSMVRLGFRHGVLTVAVAERVGREGADR